MTRPITVRSMRDRPGAPFGRAFDPDTGDGVDLDPLGYVEEEHLIDGEARRWITGPDGVTRVQGPPVRYTTRLLVRRPADPARSSGIVHVEPLHPAADGASTWLAASPSLTAAGHAWVGVAVYPHMAGLLAATIDPDRYADLSMPGDGLEWDIMADALGALHDGAVPGVAAHRVILSGWSATGSFCRVFAMEGFATARAGLVDGVVVFISSGGAGEAGYPALSSGWHSPAADDPRRTIHDVGVPVFEVLTETEAETHRRCLRPDSDEPGDRYRLYQVAGGAHVEKWPRTLTNGAALRRSGLGSPDVDVREERSDARSDLIAQALLERMAEWVTGAGTPPRAPRFEYTAEPSDNPEDELVRDGDGAVIGGIRTPWTRAPLAVYHPHGTPCDEPFAGPDWSPIVNAALAAGLIGTMTRFPPQRVIDLYGDADRYRAAFTAAARSLQEEGLLLESGVRDLSDSVDARWRAAAGGA